MFLAPIQKSATEETWRLLICVFMDRKRKFARGHIVKVCSTLYRLRRTWKNDPGYCFTTHCTQCHTCRRPYEFLCHFHGFPRVYLCNFGPAAEGGTAVRRVVVPAASSLNEMGAKKYRHDDWRLLVLVCLEILAHISQPEAGPVDRAVPGIGTVSGICVWRSVYLI